MVAAENALATTERHDLALMSPHVADSIFLSIERFEFAKKVAAMLAASPMVPAHFQGPNGVGSCMIALNLAERMRVDPFMLMQNLYVVHGRPGLEGKLTIALINGCGRFEPLEFRFEGQGKTSKGLPRNDSCLAYAKEIKSGKILEGPLVTWAMAEAEGWTADKGKEYKQTSKWQTMPQLMFMYRAATFFGRVHCPEVLMGLRTKDELDDMVIDVTPTPLKIEGRTEPAAGEDPYKVQEAPQGKEDAPGPETPPEPHRGRKPGSKNKPKDPEKAPDPNQEPLPPETGDPGPAEPPQDNEPALFPKSANEEDNAFFSEVGDYWATLDDNRVKRILEAFKIKAPADLHPNRRRSFLQTCKNQLDQQNAGK